MAKYKDLEMSDDNPADANLIGMRDIIGFLKRNWRPVLVSVLGCAMAGMFYLAVTEPIFTATARIVIDPEQARIASQDAVSGAIVIETGEVESQVEIIRSEAIAISVIAELALTEDPELQEQPSLLSRLAFWRSGNTDGKQEVALRRTVAGFLERLRVWRVGQSYVLDIAYNSVDPVKAAAVANATAQAYIKAGLEAKSSAAKSGAGWLEARLAEISRQANESAKAVEDFRNRNNISQAGPTSLDEQQVAEANIQLSRAKADAATERAKLAMINRFLESETYVDGYVDEALRSPQITALRERLTVATGQRDELKSRYGAEGTAVQAAEKEIASLQGEVRAEIVRIGQVYKSNLEAAERREQYVNEQLQATIHSGLSKGMARVQLAELESRANTYRQMYQSVMQQLISALQQESFPVGDSRLVSAAAVPLGKAWPKGSLVLALAVVLGTLGGLAYAAIREVADRRIKTAARLHRELGLSSLGTLPFVPLKSLSRTGGHESQRLLSLVMDQPNEPFADAVRSTKASLDLILRRRNGKIVGITSALPGEGKTTLASNLAQLYAATGYRTMLIDACAANPTLTRVFATLNQRLDHKGEDGGKSVDAHYGRSELAEERRRLAEVKERRNDEPYQSVAVITPPALMGVDEITHKSTQSYRYLNLQALEANLARLREQHDIIILDLPDLKTTADARIVSGTTDCVILTVGDEQNVTLDVLGAAVASCGALDADGVGVVFNNVRRSRAAAPISFWPSSRELKSSLAALGKRYVRVGKKRGAAHGV
ncbi:exopolysaccharide transport family protein [Phyllobacterium sp. 0TCS1.6C]|uniref:GumC family protein n=1 Tax=unclassified Phyllobacterium TaxID=2638441 RepID=UPI002263C94E|nr:MULTISPECIES: exopolysaccharide transport family protein [unclassified Phyllobacterium]MCX8279970.1 exopolysaccharide transport family protein [Phyllobacterium sp. 0TCS1.6C]MCX8296137.1 exopolysaccharide transport family protein [Phyllobacterium sp. 0TCS1.6A]